LEICRQDIEVGPFRLPDPSRQYISSMILEIDFHSKKKTTTEMYNSDDMAKEFLMQFTNQVTSS
jgi:vesicle-fusing ATPase